jgi:hypothetical protein
MRSRDHLRLVEISPHGPAVVTPLPVAPIAETFLFSNSEGALICIHNGREVSVSQAAIAMAALCERIRVYLAANSTTPETKVLRLIPAEDDPKDGA